MGYQEGRDVLCFVGIDVDVVVEVLDVKYFIAKCVSYRMLIIE
jgi:hypothetical protein